MTPSQPVERPTPLPPEILPPTVPQPEPVPPEIQDPQIPEQPAPIHEPPGMTPPIAVASIVTKQSGFLFAPQAAERQSSVDSLAKASGADFDRQLIHTSLKATRAIAKSSAMFSATSPRHNRRSSVAAVIARWVSAHGTDNPHRANFALTLGHGVAQQSGRRCSAPVPSRRPFLCLARPASPGQTLVPILPRTFPGQ